MLVGVLNTGTRNIHATFRLGVTHHDIMDIESAEMPSFCKSSAGYLEKEILIGLAAR